MKAENTPLLASLRSNYEELLKIIRQNPKIISEQPSRLEVAGLLGGLKIAEELKMDSTEIKSIQTGIERILKKLPENIRAEIDQLIKDPEPKPQINKLKGKKNLPSWLRFSN